MQWDNDRNIYIGQVTDVDEEEETAAGVFLEKLGQSYRKRRKREEEPFNFDQVLPLYPILIPSKRKINTWHVENIEELTIIAKQKKF